jgi:hypothetical protein
MVGGPPRGTLHTTETKGWIQRTDGGSPYHAQIRDTLDGGPIELRQYLGFDVAARSLRNMAGGVQTNRQGTRHPQLSILGYARQSADLSVPMMNSLAWFMRWCETEYDIGRRAIARTGGGGSCYGSSSPCRMPFAKWITWDGWAAHQNVPENTHWDAGKLDWEYLIMYGGGNVTPITEEQELERGDTGLAVANMQRGLIENHDFDLGEWDPYAPGYPPGADGDFGESTEDAVVQFQTAMELDPTGIVEGVTAALILERDPAVGVKLDVDKVSVVKTVRLKPE